MPDADLTDDLFLVFPDGDADSPAAATLSFSRTPTVLLNFAANRFTRRVARENQNQFGIGAMDWRMLVMLTREPGSTVSHASRTIGIDKAAVSRSLQRLSAKGLAQAAAGQQGLRQKGWVLTAQGHALHKTMLTAALERQKQVLAGFSPQDVQQLNALLTRLLENMEQP